MDRREEAIKVKEQSILKLGSVLAKHGFAEGEHVPFKHCDQTLAREQRLVKFFSDSVLATQC